MDAKGEVVWSSAYQMKMPKVCVNKEYVVAADFNGNEVYLFDSEGPVKNFTTPYNICNVEVSANEPYVQQHYSNNPIRTFLYFFLFQQNLS